jgi:uncharacterized protein YcbX
MNEHPAVSRITIFPVKSLDGISLQEVVVSSGGCLLHDREYAIIDTEGNFVVGKSMPLVHVLRTNIDIEHDLISFRHEQESQWHQFHLQLERAAINAYLSKFFSVNVVLHRNTHGRFLDIPDIAGLTVLSTASLETISGWFGEMNIEETRKRFRATIELSGVPPFWEDRLFSEQETMVKFRIGEIVVYGVSPRERCVVPTRNPETGKITHAFPKIFSRRRAETLPAWSMLEEYGNHYYLSVNCYIPSSETGKRIHVGDEVKIIASGVRSIDEEDNVREFPQE